MVPGGCKLIRKSFHFEKWVAIAQIYVPEKCIPLFIFPLN